MPDQVVRVTNGASLVVRSGVILGVGPAGPAGPVGPVGPEGPQGTILWTGPTPPSATSDPPPRDGDWWVDPGSPAGTGPTVGQVSIYDEPTDTWTLTTTEIRGPIGLTGPRGPQGIQGPQGNPGSASSGFAHFNDLLPAPGHPGYPHS